MKPLSRILGATDFSAPARHALARAFRVAHETDASLTLMHALSQGALDTLRRVLGIQGAAVETRILDEAREALAHLAADLGEARGVAAGTHLAAGTTVLRAILDQADAMDADLLVVGARGEDYLGRLLLGTTAERLLRRTSRPILVVKQVPHEDYRRVLVPVDFSAWSVRALQLARAAAPRAELMLLHAYEAPFESKLQFAGVEEDALKRYRAAARQEALDKMDALTMQAGMQRRDVGCSAHHGDASRIILAEEQEQDCDLIVMGKHGEGMMEELLLGSVTKHVLSESSCDVLVASDSALRP
jgi:nucleotide-binding universal stress UspA family protein